MRSEQFFLILVVFSGVQAMSSKNKEKLELFSQGIFDLREAFSLNVLTKALVEEKLCKAPIEDGKTLMNFAKEIRGAAFESADKVVKKGDAATDRELENVLAALGILQWAGLEAYDSSCLVHHYLVTLEERLSNRSDQRKR